MTEGRVSFDGAPPIVPVTGSFFICATPRTGSSLLAEALEFTGIAGTPREYFEPEYERDWASRLGIAADSDYLPKILAAGMTPNGVFGAKVHWHQFVHLAAKLRGIHGRSRPVPELIHGTFPGLKFVFLTRRDKIRQAVSYYKAQRTDVWHVITPGAKTTRTANGETATFDFDQIDQWLIRFALDEACWFRYFEMTDVEPFEVVYEDFLEAYDSTVLAILRYLNVSIPARFEVGPPRLNKLADATSEDWVSRYEALSQPKRRLRPTPSRAYFISTTPRTGGFLLAEALQSTGIAGRPREYFDRLYEQQCTSRRAPKSDSEYLETVMAAGTTPNGVFGAKVLWHQFVHLIARPRVIHECRTSGIVLLRHLFPDLRYVFLTRRDKIRQAVSYHRAIRSGTWWSIGKSGQGNGQTASHVEPPPIDFDFDQIDEWVKRLTQFETSWRRHFQRVGVVPLEIAYEDFVQSYEPSVLAVLDYLGLPISDSTPSIAPPRLQKQADQLTEEWVDRYKRRKGL